MKAFLMALCMLAFATQAARADPPRDGPDRPTVKRAKQPVGTPHKSNSFAPHPGSRQRVYGDPIQRPIVRHVTPKKKPLPPK